MAAFGMSCAAAGMPALGWPTFFEEPAMLLGVVLLGKNLEERAKLAASSDMASLQVALLHLPFHPIRSCFSAIAEFSRSLAPAPD